MPDDEPLDDARAVGIAAAAATAKVVETAARAAADRQGRGPIPAQHDPTTDRRLNELAAAERWAASQNPDRLHHYYAERDGALRGAHVDTERLQDAESSLVADWRRTTSLRGSGAEDGKATETNARDAAVATPAYDSAERRAGADRGMKAAGVADEPRKARLTSDLLNGADPRTASTAGKSARTSAAASATRTPEQTRTR